MKLQILCQLYICTPLAHTHTHTRSDTHTHRGSDAHTHRHRHTHCQAHTPTTPHTHTHTHTCTHTHTPATHVTHMHTLVTHVWIPVCLHSCHWNHRVRSSTSTLPSLITCHRLLWFWNFNNISVIWKLYTAFKWELFIAFKWLRHSWLWYIEVPTSSTV